MAVTKTPNPFVSGAPLMRTLSALGVLRNSAQPPYPRIGFVTPEVYQRVRQYWWNDPLNKDPSLTGYTLLPRDQPDAEEKTPSRNEQKVERNSADDKLYAWFGNPWIKPPNKDRLRYVYETGPNTSPDDLVKMNRRLEQLRRYIFIIQSAAPPPPNAFVSYAERGAWYYIDGDDVISQRNFNLVVLFLTVMAYPASTAPLTTSISVGGG